MDHNLLNLITILDDLCIKLAQIKPEHIIEKHKLHLVMVKVDQVKVESHRLKIRLDKERDRIMNGQE